MRYLLHLGRLADLSWYELTQNLSTGVQLSKVTETIAQVEFTDSAALTAKLEALSGIIKASSVVATLATPDQAIELISDDLIKNDRTDFSVYSSPQSDTSEHMKAVKRQLRTQQRSARFVLPKGDGLSASVLLHQKVSEYGIIQLQSELLLIKTVWVQNIDHWSFKDAGKPQRDPKKGMLPPKLAHMMVNFISPDIQHKPGKRLYDPFCGTGTILIEALELGWNTVGSDLTQSAVQASAENLHWFTTQQHLPQQYALFSADATHVTPQQLGTKIDAIVTEPFLGKQQPSEAQLPNVFKGLEKLYWGALKRWKAILNDQAELVIVTPLVQLGKHEYSLASLIDKSRELGYSIISGPMIYTREQTIVKRAIYHIKYHS